MTAPAAPPEIRAAKSFLERRNIDTNKVSPRMFAQASKELDQGFRATYEALRDAVKGDNDASA